MKMSLVLVSVSFLITACQTPTAQLRPDEVISEDNPAGESKIRNGDHQAHSTPTFKCN